jgi:hypothetical protein
VTFQPGHPPTPIPPPPPSRLHVVRSWIRHQARAGHRGVVVAEGAVCAALLAGVLATALGLLLQPRFTVLELGAQRLAPEQQTAQPPIEQVGRYEAFDRRYIVRFPAPSGGLPAVLTHARRQRWTVRARDGTRHAVLERDGVVAVVDVSGGTILAETRVAAWVRVRQRQARWGAVVLGGLLGGLWVWAQVRRRPRSVPVATARAGAHRRRR